MKSPNIDTKYSIVFDQSLSMISQQNLDLIRARRREHPDTRKARICLYPEMGPIRSSLREDQNHFNLNTLHTGF